MKYSVIPLSHPVKHENSCGYVGESYSSYGGQSGYALPMKIIQGYWKVIDKENLSTRVRVFFPLRSL